MLNIGMTELLIFGIIALLILGPEKLPEAVRFVGKLYGKVTRTVSNIQNDFDRELRLTELREQMQAEMARIQELESKMQAQMNELKQPIKVDEVVTSPPMTHAPKTIKTLNYQLIQEKQSAVYLPHACKTTSHFDNFSDMKVAV